MSYLGTARSAQIYGLAEKKAVILDLGTAYIKCGYAGEAAPRHVLPSPLGSYLRRPAGTDPPTPAQWRDVLARCLGALYFRVLNAKPKEHRVVVCEDWLAPQQYRQALCHVLFEQLSVPSVLFVSSTEALLYTSGESTGIMVDVGDAETRVMPIYEGHVIASAYTTSIAGSATLRTAVAGVLSGGGAGGGAQHTHHTESAESKGGDAAEATRGGSSPVGGSVLTRTMLEDLLVRLCPLDEEGPEGSVTQGEKEGEREKEGAAVNASEKEEVYRGGSRGAGVRIGAKERAALREACDRVLFDGIATGTGDSSVAGAVVEALKRSPREARPALARNIVVGGGTAAMRGFVGRLAATLGEAADLLARVDVELKERTTQSEAGARGEGRRIQLPPASASCSTHHHLVDLVHPLRRARVYCGGAVYECHGSAGGERGAGEGEEDTKGGAAEEEGGGNAVAERTGRQTGSQAGGGTGSQTAPPQLQPNCMPWIGASIVGSLDEPKPKAAPRGTRGGGSGGAGGGRDPNHSGHSGFYIAKNTWMKSVEARGEGVLPSRDMTSWALAGGGGGVQRA